MKRVDENPPARHPDRPITEAATPWWVAKVKPRQEKAMAFDFINLDIEYYLPLFTKVTRRKDNNKPRKSVLPLFPGYISFCAEKARLREALATGRLVNIIEIRHQKRFVGELSQIFFALGHGIVLEPFVEAYPEGTRVLVVSGPLRGIRGVIAKIHNNNKLVLSVEGLGRAALSVDQSQVRPDPVESHY
jgi:transcription termination/antitermination protein NusG